MIKRGTPSLKCSLRYCVTAELTSPSGFILMVCGLVAIDRRLNALARTLISLMELNRVQRRANKISEVTGELRQKPGRQPREREREKERKRACTRKVVGVTRRIRSDNKASSRNTTTLASFIT